MRVIICDRCRKHLTQVEKVGFVHLDWKDVSTGYVDGNKELKDWDFCPECMAEIESFVKMKPKEKPEEHPEEKPGADPEPAAQPAEDPEPKKQKPKKEKGEKKIDVGRIHALASAGWPVKEIAADVGCSEPTVYKYLKQGENDGTENQSRDL